MACTGWHWDDVGQQLDLPRLAAMNAYWQDNPPLHLLVKAFVGYKGSGRSESDTTKPEVDLLQALSAFS